MSFAIAGRDAGVASSIWITSFEVNASVTLLTESGLAHPKSVAQACDEVRLRSSRKPLFGLLIWPHVAKPGGQTRINPSSPPDKTPHIGRFRFAIAQRERVA